MIGKILFSGAAFIYLILTYIDKGNLTACGCEILSCIGKNAITKIFTNIVDYLGNYFSSSVTNSQPDNAIPLINEIKEDMKAVKDDFNSFKDDLKNNENRIIIDHNNINYHLQILFFVFIILFTIIFLTVILMLLFQNKKVNSSKKVVKKVT